jgi:mono/diheme cytochrome c family protein
MSPTIYRRSTGLLLVAAAAGSLTTPASAQSDTPPQIVASDDVNHPAATYYGDVLPIIQQTCQGCHRPGEVAPMSLLTYDDLREAARETRRMVASRRMPPWTADPSASVPFHNDRSLTDEQIATIVEWIDGGMPEGDPSLAPPQPEFPSGWQIQPDEIIEVPEFDIPAEGTVEYTYFIMPEVFDEDRWLVNSELRPTNSEVTHHLLAYIRPPGSSYFRTYPVGEFFVPDGEDRAPVEGESSSQWRQAIGGYAPGINPGDFVAPPGQAALVPAGSQIVFELHYTAKGDATTDRPKLGLVYLDGEPTTRRVGGVVINTDFEIPPGAENHRVDAAVTITQDAKLLSLNPHMHLRGKAWEFRAVFPDGTTEVLLTTPRYDFNWQMTHHLSEPMMLPAGTVIEASAWYDNSDTNRHNPDPTLAVGWGDQSWEEMMVGFFDLEVPPNTDIETLFERGGN